MHALAARTNGSSAGSSTFRSLTVVDVALNATHAQVDGSRVHVFTGVAVPDIASPIVIVIGSQHLSMLRMPWIATDIVRKELLFADDVHCDPCHTQHGQVLRPDDDRHNGVGDARHCDAGEDGKAGAIHRAHDHVTGACGE
eukprot:TRINITY_DN4675_c0_g3_i1.p4 TRINITY_DN4675_c0_g3~~TRINITY_DN4675_c0_g3_i1.p4  ORF type:complete len:141 (+),score=16.67 TRINITY_DN4675_c0_g3_i1:1569-1991(+)